jgi:hypothetical protein
MNVADLQQHLANLGRLLEASGAKGVAADLGAIRDGLAPFRDHSLKTFAEFLIKADTYTKGGLVPVAGGGKRRAGAEEQARGDLESLGRELQSLYERSSSPEVTTDQIDALVGRLAALPKDGLAAEGIGLMGMKAKTKPAIQGAIRQRILDRKGAVLRSSGIDRL